MSGLVFITGLSGAGKTTLGERLKLENNFLHFNVDVWAFGGDAVVDSDKVPDAAMNAKRDPEIKLLFDNMYENGIAKLLAGEEPVLSTFHEFFDRLVPAILEVRNNNPERDFVVTFSVYMRETRDYIRALLGQQLAFIVLNPSIEKVADRRVRHWQESAKERNQSLWQFLTTSIMPNIPPETPEMAEDAILAALYAYASSGATGFESAQEDEPATLGINDCTIDEAHKRIVKFLYAL